MSNTLKFWLIAALVGLAVITSISWLYRHYLLQSIQQGQYQTAVAISQVLSRQTALQTATANTPLASRYRTQLQNQLQALATKVKVLNADGTTLFSTLSSSLERPPPARTLIKNAQSGQGSSLLLWLASVDGTQQPIVVSAVPINAKANSKASALLVAYADVSEQITKLENQQWQLTALLVAGLLPLFLYQFWILRRSHTSIQEEKNTLLEQNRSTKHKADRDTLTNLPNRSLLLERINQALIQAKPKQSTFVLMFLDLDGFKAVNDTLGHQTGDQLLRIISKRLTECVREGDTVARLGGDEFVVLLPLFDSRYRELEADVAKRILTTIAAPMNLRGQQITLGCSIGISTYPHHGSSVEVLLKNADEAMYRAKNDGRNNFKFFAPKPGNKPSETTGLQEDLRRAIDNQEFRLHFQPRANIKDGSIAGATASIHWQHSSFGLVEADKFFPKDSKGGVTPIGDWLLKAVCNELHQWQQRGIKSAPITINIDKNLFHLGRLEQDISKIFSHTKVDPSMLELNFGDSLEGMDDESIQKLVTALHSLGISIALEGSSLSPSLLQQLPVQRLNIAPLILEKITSSTADVAITRAIICMAKSISAASSAEQVTSKQQLALLRKMGCDQLQGDYYRPPLTKEDLMKLIRSEASAQAPAPENEIPKVSV